jgi:hypothetical protein
VTFFHSPWLGVIAAPPSSLGSVIIWLITRRRSASVWGSIELEGVGSALRIPYSQSRTLETQNQISTLAYNDHPSSLTATDRLPVSAAFPKLSQRRAKTTHHLVAPRPEDQPGPVLGAVFLAAQWLAIGLKLLECAPPPHPRALFYSPTSPKL